MTGSQQFVHWVMRDSSRTPDSWRWPIGFGYATGWSKCDLTGTVDLTDGGRITLREGDWVGFYLQDMIPLVMNSSSFQTLEESNF